MTIRKANKERLLFWSEFVGDAMESLRSAGFSREEAVALVCAIISGKEIMWQTPPGYVDESRNGMH